MTSDIIDLLMQSSTKTTINTQPRIVNNIVQQEAVDIMRNFKNGEIRLRQATNSVELQIVQDMISLADRHERYKKYMPFPEHIARHIVSVYKQAEMLGMIDDGEDLEKEKLKQENEILKKKIVRLQGQLDIQEEINKPSETFVSEVEEKDE